MLPAFLIGNDVRTLLRIWLDMKRAKHKRKKILADNFKQQAMAM